MSFKLITYNDGKQISEFNNPDLFELLVAATSLLQLEVDEYEILDAKGHVIAYAYGPDSEKAKQLELDYEIERKAALEEDRRGHYD